MKVLTAALVLFALAGCAPQGRFEKAGAAVDNSIHDVREGVQDVVKDVRDTAKDVGDDAKQKR